MLVGQGSNLREMGNAKNLVMPGQLPDLPGHGLCRLAADPGIDFVENNRVYLIFLGQKRL